MQEAGLNLNSLLDTKQLSQHLKTRTCAFGKQEVAEWKQEMVSDLEIVVSSLNYACMYM